MLWAYQPRFNALRFQAVGGRDVEHKEICTLTNEEAKTALQKRTPVTYNGVHYSYISAIIYRYDRNGNLLISAELTDKNQHSVTIAQIKDVITTHDQPNQATAFLS